jgi:solute carrier family 13 (sodium-dependent dicarboxylate transporter), member 2/3/5
VLSDAGIAVSAALLLFVLPDGGPEGAPLLPWEATTELPWNVLILIGGGLSLGSAIESSGLAGWVGHALAGLQALPVPLVVAAGAVLALLLSHVMSNTATAAALVPLLATLAGNLGQPPLRLALPAVLACSCAFMLPVASPPNAIVHGTGLIATSTMARAGAPLALVAIVVVLLVSWLLAGVVAPA